MATPVSSPLSFGALLKRQRRLARMSQAQLAKRAGYSVSYISMLERGGRTALASTAEILAAALESSDVERAALLNALRRAVATDVETDVAREQATGNHTGDLALPVGGFLGARPDGPLVARADELRVALAALDVALAGAGRLVMLAGEPGIGKTRLAQEVALQARARGALVATGRCYEPQATTAFYPVSEALGVLCASMPPALRGQMAQRWPDVRALLPDAPAAFSAAPAPASGHNDRQRLLWQVTDFVQAVAALRPVALMLDDLHWADEASLDCLSHLIRHTRTARVLVIGTYRAVEMHHQPVLRATLLDLVRERLLERVTLRRLEAEETAVLVAATLGVGTPDAVAADLIELIVHTTEGHPFFVQEIVRALVERGDIVGEDSQWRRRAFRDTPGRTPSDMEVPESVRGTIDARVARLSPLAQAVLQEASVLGQTFTFDSLRRMGRRPQREVEDALEEALAAELIREVAGEGTDQAYGFNHALTQRAIALEISAPRRRRLHRAAGEALEALPEHARRRRAAELAWHFQQGDDLERALPYSLVAGEEAERVYAYSDAARHYRLAGELARELGDQRREADALTCEGRLLGFTGSASEARAALERAADLCRMQGDLNGLARTIAILVRAWDDDSHQGFARVVALLRELSTDPVATRGGQTNKIAAGYSGGVEKSLDESGALKRLVVRATKRLAPCAAAQIEIALASLLNGMLWHEEMVAIAQRAVTHARAAADLSLLAQAQQFRALGLSFLGRVEQAIAIFEQVIQMAESASDLRTLQLSLSNLGGLLINLGEFARVAPVCMRMLRVAERIRDPMAIVNARGNLTELAFFRGDWREARVLAEQLAAFDQLDQPRPMCQFFGTLLALVGSQSAEERGEAAANLEPYLMSADVQAQEYASWALAEYHLVEGRAQAAQALLEPLVAQYHQDQLTAPRNRSLLGWAHLELGDERRADETIAHTLAQTARQQTRLFRVDALRVRALIALRAGRMDDAQAAVEESLALCRAMPSPYIEAKMLAVYGQWHQARGEPEHAREWYAAALAILDQLGERLYAQQIERALAELNRPPSPR